MWIIEFILCDSVDGYLMCKPLLTGVKGGFLLGCEWASNARPYNARVGFGAERRKTSVCAFGTATSFRKEAKTSTAGTVPLL